MRQREEGNPADRDVANPCGSEIADRDAANPGKYLNRKSGPELQIELQPTFADGYAKKIQDGKYG